MKKLFLLFIVVLTVSSGSAQGCLPEGIIFTAQAQIDSFPINYAGCTQIEGNVTIGTSNYFNDITNLNGLSGLTSIGGNLTFQRLHLSSLTGLTNLTSIGDWLKITYNYQLNSLTGMEGVTSIGGGLTIFSNNDLTSLTGLEGVTSIDGDLYIYGNTVLSSLAGLANFTSIGGELYIENNEVLNSLTGLDKIMGESVSDLTIAHNISLSTCEVQCICDFLASPYGTIEIFDNDTGCDSQQEVEEACDATGVESLNPESSFTIYPNPAADHLIIELTDRDNNMTGTISVYGMTGQELIRQQVRGSKVDINVSLLPKGIYFVRLLNQEKIEVRKFTKS